MIWLFIVIFGASQGATTLARPSILAELYGSSHYGRISSIMAIFLTLATTSAPLGASLIYDTAGSYRPVLWLVFILASLAAITAFAAKNFLSQSQRREIVELQNATPIQFEANQ
jgi:MFS family permease